MRFSLSIPIAATAKTFFSDLLPRLRRAAAMPPPHPVPLDAPGSPISYPVPLSPPLPPSSKQVELDRAMSASSRSSAFSLSRSHVVYEDEWLLAVDKPPGVYCESVLASAPRLVLGDSATATGDTSGAASWFEVALGEAERLHDPELVEGARCPAARGRGWGSRGQGEGAGVCASKKRTASKRGRWRPSSCHRQRMNSRLGVEGAAAGPCLPGCWARPPPGCWAREWPGCCAREGSFVHATEIRRKGMVFNGRN